MKTRGVGILVGILGVLLIFRQVLFFKPGSQLWADAFDAKLVYWIVSWGHYILFEDFQPLNFWNANSFYPATNTLAYSESILSIQLLFAPLRALGLDPLSALYISLAGFAVTGCFFSASALRRIWAISALETAIIVFAAHFSLSLTSFLYHYQLFGFELAPAFFLYLYLYLRDFRKKDLLIVCMLFCVGTSFSTYLAPMLLVLSIFLGMYCLILRAVQLGPATLLLRIGWASPLIGLGFAVLLYVIQIRPYLALSSELSPPKQSYVDYSASLSSLFSGFSIYSYWYSPVHFKDYGQWESSYFPGFLLLSLAGLFVLRAAARNLPGVLPAMRSHALLRLKQTPEETAFNGYMLLFLLLLLALSLGPYLKDLQLPWYPYVLLSKAIPGIVNIRAPGRFGALVGLPLAVFSVAEMRKMRLRSGLVLALFLLLVVESLPTYPTFPFAVDPDGIYAKMAAAIRPGEVVLELPIFGKDHYATIENVQNQLVGSTIGWPTLLVGYGAKTTPTYEKVLYLDSLVQGGNDVQTLTSFAYENQVADLLVYLPAYPSAIGRQWRSFAARPSVCKLFEADGYLLVRLDPGNCPGAR